ncbi:hypothetical protein [Pseudarthrobacter sp. SORGH_AS 212]|uniref:hypothetical protein n=1 Tax=Pseudarthrobacter sp. SORGH_AS 212 TaxID=3041777 RepID=UPI0032B814DD
MAAASAAVTAARNSTSLSLKSPAPSRNRLPTPQHDWSTRNAPRSSWTSPSGRSSSLIRMLAATSLRGASEIRATGCGRSMSCAKVFGSVPWYSDWANLAAYSSVTGHGRQLVTAFITIVSGSTPAQQAWSNGTALRTSTRAAV